MERNLEELHRIASGHYLKGEFPAAMEAWRQVLEIQPDDERAREGLRLCEQLHRSDDDAATVGSGSGATAAPSDGRPARGDESAAAELKRRVDELLAEAQSLVEEGQTEQALRTLDRVLILDEENADALAMQGQLDRTFESDDPLDAEPDLAPMPEADPESDPFLDDEPLDLEFELADSQDPPPPEDRPVEATPEPELEAIPLDLGYQAAEVPPPLADEPPPPAAAAPAPAPATPTPAPAARSRRGLFQNRRVLLGVGGVVLLLATIGALQMFGGDGDAPVAVVQANDALAGRGPDEAQPAQDPGRAEEPDPVADTPAAVIEEPEPRSESAALMAEAEAALASEDYATAVIAFDKVLELEPDNSVARTRLKLAADRYREQQGRQEKWIEAVEAFHNGHHAEALRMFYRMNPGDYDADLSRCKVNGWYNLGVAALKASDCERAVDHFDEARAIRPDDLGLRAALELAELCRGPAVQADIKRLGFRQLND